MYRFNWWMLNRLLSVSCYSLHVRRKPTINSMLQWTCYPHLTELLTQFFYWFLTIKFHENSEYHASKIMYRWTCSYTAQMTPSVCDRIMEGSADHRERSAKAQSSDFGAGLLWSPRVNIKSRKLHLWPILHELAIASMHAESSALTPSPALTPSGMVLVAFLCVDLR